MEISAEFDEHFFLVKKSQDASRLYSKSHLGKILPGNQLRLDILEGLFLLGEGKLVVYQNKKKLDFHSLLVIAAKKIPEFEIKYLVFRDLRKRGYPIQLDDQTDHIHFHIYKMKTADHNDEQPHFISAFSERDILDIDETKTLIRSIEKRNSTLWFIIVDEEGDLTYYDVSLQNLTGNIPTSNFSKGTGILLENRVVLFDEPLISDLLKHEFYGKPFGEGLQLSLVEALYLVEQEILSIQTSDGKTLSYRKLQEIIKQRQPDIELRLLVFRDLKQRGLIVKTGYKFGTHFRAYTKNPDETHAEYLIHVVRNGFKSSWAEISRAVRLAHSVNKNIVFARVDGNIVDYICFGRLRP